MNKIICVGLLKKNNRYAYLKPHKETIVIGKKGKYFVTPFGEVKNGGKRSNRILKKNYKENTRKWFY